MVLWLPLLPLGVAATETPATRAPDTYQMPFTATTRDAAVAWRDAARAKLLGMVEAVEAKTPISEVPLDVQLGPPEDEGAYTLYHLSFRGNGAAEVRFAAMLAIPHGDGPFPGMVCLHGHGGSADLVFDRTSIYHGFADRFARGGYAVLAPSFPHRDYAAMALWDLMRCLDILMARPEVDPERVGVGGLSMGGEWTMWLAACDERPKVAVVSGWMCTTEGVFAVPNCACWQLPGLVGLMDIGEVELLIAPRPVLFESAEQDPCFPIRYTREGFARIRAGYAIFGAEEAVAQDTWQAGHEWHGVKAYPFVDRVLSGSAAEVE
jgi:dienelactone hydrolase